MQYNANAGISLSMPLYNQTVFAAIDVSRTVERINSLSYDKAMEDLTVQIGKVYYMAQASQEQERLTSRNVARMEELYAITEALYQQGVVLEVDLPRKHQLADFESPAGTVRHALRAAEEHAAVFFESGA